jgi:hypothetical protein
MKNRVRMLAGPKEFLNGICRVDGGVRFAESPTNRIAVEFLSN